MDGLTKEALSTPRQGREEKEGRSLLISYSKDWNGQNGRRVVKSFSASILFYTKA